MARTEWDYSALAAHYDSRAEYAVEAIDAILAGLALASGSQVADVGAGTGKLARPMAQRGLVVSAVEPNDQMREYGIRNTRGMAVSWREGTGEATGLSDGSVNAVTFGSSFNVVNQQAALAESRRIVKQGGGFCCMWNHRDLDDPLQARIETIIRREVPGYDYGTRRQDPSEVLRTSGMFEQVTPFSAGFAVEMTRDALMDAWRSHGTVARQAGVRFKEVLQQIEDEIDADVVQVPYTTRGWYARFRG